ncbi:hypothetical protein ES703_91188 [subsurface metagenome]
MNKSNIRENFKELIEKDINCLIQNRSGIDIFNKFNELKLDFSMDLTFFKRFVNKFCFKSSKAEKTKELYVEGAQIDAQNNNNLVENKLLLFKQIFFSNSNINEVEYIAFKSKMLQKLPDRIELLYLLYYKIFKIKIVSDKSIKQIYDLILEEWRSTIQNQKFSVKIFTLYICQNPLYVL